MVPAPGDPGSFEWTNPSVVAFAQGRDPVAAISCVVADILLRAADEGAFVLPTNPLELAELMGLRVHPHFDTADARLITTGHPTGAGKQRPAGHAPLRSFVTSGADLVIEYNPTRPRGRLRYSVAHEIIHALFPDADEDVRNRTHTGAVVDAVADDSWQLELLCNVGAAELLMPTDAIEGLLDIDTDIDFLMAQRARFNVSTEALLRRLIHATPKPMALAAYNRVSDRFDADLRCEYVLGSRSWAGGIARGDHLAQGSGLEAPTAVGQTSRGLTELVGRAGEPARLDRGDRAGEPSPAVESATASMQMVGIPPYPGLAMPRLLALVEPVGDRIRAANSVRYVTADILAAIAAIPGSADDSADDSAADGGGAGDPVLIAHVVNDQAHGWGGAGVASVLSRALPDAAKAFRSWTIADAENLTLGNVHVVDVWSGARRVFVASMVAQSGYGPSAMPRLSYSALADALAEVAGLAERLGSPVHMPRIGAGQAGGRWDLIEATLERTMLDRGIDVVVYTRPSGRAGSPSPAGRYARQGRL